VGRLNMSMERPKTVILVAIMDIPFFNSGCRCDSGEA